MHCVRLGSSFSVVFLCVPLSSDVFVAVYMIMSFAIPGFRIKLEAEPAVVFVETLKILWPFKAAVSLIAAVLVGGLPLVLGKRK